MSRSYAEELTLNEEIAVTLDGTVFHKAGLITGGSTNAGTGRKWEEAQVQGKPSDCQNDTC